MQPESDAWSPCLVGSLSTPANPLPENAPPVLVTPTQTLDQTDPDEHGKPDSARQLVLDLLFGFVFGSLLQKGGVAKYEVLMGLRCTRTYFA